MLSLDLFHDYYAVKGGGTPISDKADGARDLTLLGSGTAPRASSYKKRRGAEFRSSGFSATAPRAFASATSSGLNTALYASSKIKSFTIAGWVRPQKTGISAVGLSVVGGLFSATNVGATPWIYDQPCLVLMDAVAGAGFVVVSCFGTLLDTRTATQTVGPASTTPLADGDYSFVAVRVTGSATVNNQVDAVALYTRTIDGVVRVYTLGEHKASARFKIGSTIPSNNDTVTIQGRARTFKTTLSGSAAAGQLTYGGSGNAADGETFVVGDDTYTWRTYVGSGKAASTRFEFGSSIIYNTNTPKTRFISGGYLITCLWGTKYPDGASAGALGFGSVTSDIGVAASKKVFDAWLGSYDGLKDFITPAPPATGYLDAGRSWANRRTIPGTSSTTLSAPDVSREIALRALSVGAAGNGTQILVVEQTAATGAYDLPCTPCRLGRNSPYLARVKATSTDVITAAIAGSGTGLANGTYKYTCTFVHASGESVEQSPTTLVMSGGPKDVSLSTIPIGPTGTTARKIYRTKVGGSVYFLLTTISDNTTTTYTDSTADASLPATTLPTTIYMTGGADAAGSKSVLIGATWADSQANAIKAINATGTPGTEYSADITTANATATASASGNNIALASKFQGSAGNGKPLSESMACLSGVTAFSGGGTGVDDEVLIGASAQASWQNMADAINQTGSAGIAYGTDGSLPLDAYATAEMKTGYMTVRSKESGTAGNGRTLATTVAGVTIQDEFGDKTLTAMTGGQAAPPFTVPSGARPDNADLRLVWGGLPAL